jgi:hypothetical protein
MDRTTRRRGKTLVAAALIAAAALTMAGTITATGAVDHEPTQAQAAGSNLGPPMNIPLGDGVDLAQGPAGGKTGPHTVTYQSLDDSTAQAASWTPGRQPASTPIGLTADEPGAELGEPDKFYPTGTGVSSRIVPTAHIQPAGTGDTGATLKVSFETQDRQSVLATYSIDENGDTTLTDHG